MADCGVASRRKSEEIIEAGKVKVNGHIAHIGDKINPKGFGNCLRKENQ